MTGNTREDLIRLACSSALRPVVDWYVDHGKEWATAITKLIEKEDEARG